MTIQIDDQTAELLRAQARARGLSLEEFLRSIANGAGSSPLMTTPAPDAVREFDAALDELFAADTRKLPASAATFSRSDIYADHD